MDLEFQFKKLKKNAGIKPLAALYMHCYLEGDHKFIRQIMDEEMMYDVPNTSLLNANPLAKTSTNGARNVLDTFDEYRRKMDNIRCEVRSRFITKDTAYYDWLLRYDQCGKHLCGASESHYYHIILPVNSVLTIHKNRIVKHYDYIDYSVIYKQIQSQTPRVA